MKKVIIGAVVVLVIAGVGAPFVSGLVTEKMVQEYVDNLNAIYSETGTDVSVEIISYDRHFYSSDIEWKLKFGSLQALYGVDEVIFVDHADHGYTGIVIETRLEKNKWFTDFVEQKLDGKNPLLISTELKLTGQLTSTITLEQFSLSVEGEVAQIKPGKVVTITDKNLETFITEMQWEGCTVEGKMQASGFFARSNMEKISPYLWDGTLQYGLENVKITEDAVQFDLADFKGDYSFDVDKENNKVSVVSTIGVKEVQTGSQKVTDSFVRMAINNMDANGFEDFMKLYAEMANSIMQEIAEAEDDPEKMKTIFQEQMAGIQFQLISAYEKLLKKGLEFQISDLFARLPMGEVKGNALVHLNKDMTFAQFVPLMQQPELIFDIISLQSDLRFPAELAGDKPSLVAPLFPGMQTGFFVKEGNQLVHRTETKDSKLYLNGKEVVL